MKQLYTEIPDADAVLALSPEELGIIILMLLKAGHGLHSAGLLHPSGLVSEIGRHDTTMGETSYPLDRLDALKLAAREAFSWLQAQCLIVPSLDTNNASGYFILSRRAKEFSNSAVALDWVTAAKLQRDLLHPSIANDAWHSILRAKYPEAIFSSMRAVEIAVREAGGFDASVLGIKLVRKAFGKGGPLRDARAEENEEDALEHLFAGAIGSYKNPHSHRNVPVGDPKEAVEIVMLASHLLGIVDARRAAS